VKKLYAALHAAARLWRASDEKLAAKLPRRVQTRLAYSLVPVAFALSAMGSVAIGFEVGQTAGVDQPAHHLLAQGALAGADRLPPVATRPEPTTTLAAAPEPAAAPVAPTLRGALPVGKGMWLYQPSAVEGGDPNAIVARAQSVGLTHLFVRTGSSKRGFYAADFLNALLPVAHAHGIRVYGWDFPYFDDVAKDVDRAVEAIRFTTSSGDRIDGFSADIELVSMGVKVTPENANAYGSWLRQHVGAEYPLIATVPRPSPKLKTYPYAQVVKDFDAIAPMVYWLNRDPVSDVTGAIRDLSPFGKPIIPIGQAYDGAADHGPPGVPGRAAILAFMEAAERSGATSVSFWSWQHASQEAWDAIKDAPQFVLPVAPGGVFSPGQVRAYQYLLTSLGFPTAVDGVWSQATADAVVAYQRAAHLPQTGVIDDATRKLLLQPFKVPLLGH
jgi:hypothetical protein